MSQPTPDSRQYYLGIGGEQSGPYTEAGILEKIKNESVPKDAFIWYEGLNEWMPITSISEFESAFENLATVKPAATQTENPLAATSTPNQVAAEAQTEKNKNAEEKIETPEAQNRSPHPAFDGEQDLPFNQAPAGAAVFSGEESRFDAEEQQFLKTRAGIVSLTVGALVILTLGGFLLFSGNGNNDELASAPKPPPRPKFTPQQMRERSLRKALSELSIKPKASLKTLRELIVKNSKDDVGKQAVSAAVDYLRQRQRPTEAGDLLIAAKRPNEAYKMYLMDPPNYIKAEKAVFDAYGLTPDNELKRKYLLENIQLLLGPLNKKKTAITRIQQFEKEFPKSTHPYTYYLKPQDQKIVDIFNRISFYFVGSILSHIDTSFPQIKLQGRPLVELKTDRSNNYRITATYKGAVQLNRDKMEDIFLIFWLSQERWHLVDTNLTPQRSSKAKREKEKLLAATASAPRLLEYLENLFRIQFPKRALHESVSTEDLKKAKKNSEF